MGGLARRASELNRLKRLYPHPVVFELGNLFARKGRDRRLKARLAIKGLNRLGYDLLGLGPSDFSLGIDFLQARAREASFPLLVSNLESKAGTKGWYRQFVLLNRGGRKVAFVSLLPQDAFLQLGAMRLLLAQKGYSITPPSLSLSRLIPRLRTEADLLVLISWLGEQDTRTLVRHFPGVDLVFVLGKFARGLDEDYFVDGQPMLIRAYPRGEAVGHVTLDLDRRPLLEDLDLTLLTSRVPGDKMLDAMLERALQAAEQRRKPGNRQRLRKQILQMTPEQFLQWQQEGGTDLQ